MDRLSGQMADWPRAPRVTGQWRFTGRVPLRIRQVDIQRGDALLAGPDGSFHLAGLGDQRPEPATVPDRDALRTLNLMGEAIRERALGQPWLDWLTEPPLMRPASETLEETELERQMAAKLGRLDAVCKRPRMHLKLEEERQPVSRCKRPARRAAEVLAARSEDWDRRTLWGIKPKRVLGLVRDDLYDLYENRVAVALVDRLDKALVQRIREVRRILHAARSMERWNETLAQGRNYRRAQRVCSLWGDLWQTEGLRQRADDALRRIQRLRRRVLGLRDSRLYQKIGGQRRPMRLRMTNVLTHDELYRAVAELWMAWERHMRPGDEDPQSVWAREQRAATAMSLHAALVVVRALDALRMEPTEADLETCFEVGGSLHLRGPCGELELSWDEDLALVLRRRTAEEPLRIVALPAMVEGSLRAERWLASLPNQPLLVLHLEVDRPNASEETRVRLNGPGPRHHWPQFAPIAPWQLDSVERVARAIRWYAWRALYSRYPSQVTFPTRSWLPPKPSPAWVEVGQKSLKVIVPPRDQDGWPALRTRKDWAALEVDRLEGRLGRLARRNTADRKHLKKLLADQILVRDQDMKVLEALDIAVQEVRLLCACPVCREIATAYDFQAVQGRFRATCQSCGTQWGLRDCGACERRFSFIDFPENEPGAHPLEVDGRYGCDVLAYPVEPGVHLCTHCGKRSDGVAT